MLSQAGEQRAERLVRVLKDVRITAIYTSEFQRTKKTAEPLARTLKISPVSIPIADREGLVKRIRTDNREDVVLIVGHSQSLTGLLKSFGSPDDVNITADEFDNLFIVVPAANGPPTVLRLRY